MSTVRTYLKAIAYIDSEDLKEILIILPTLEEQQKIVDFIDNRILEIVEIINKEQKQIDLLFEYRTTLIIEAVTGKIDVRDL